MKKPFLEVIRFDSSDVILTSETHTWNVYTHTMYCPADHNEDGDKHFYLQEIIIYPSMSVAKGVGYQNDKEITHPVLPRYQFKDNQLPTEADLYKWYYLNDGKYELCNSGK